VTCLGLSRKYRRRQHQQWEYHGPRSGEAFRECVEHGINFPGIEIDTLGNDLAQIERTVVGPVEEFSDLVDVVI